MEVKSVDRVGSNGMPIEILSKRKLADRSVKQYYAASKGA
jgi:hypothetical protein